MQWFNKSLGPYVYGCMVRLDTESEKFMDTRSNRWLLMEKKEKEKRVICYSQRKKKAQCMSTVPQSNKKSALSVNGRLQGWDINFSFVQSSTLGEPASNFDCFT